jgi:predicted nucleic acid-binding protein
MSAADFYDTNILLYLVSGNDRKAGIAEKLLAGRGTISTQVMDEFTSVATRKYGLTISQTKEILGLVRQLCDVVPHDIAVHDQGMEFAARYKYSIFDAMLLAAAKQAGCTIFYSEDLQHGQKVDGLTIRNPFV